MILDGLLVIASGAVHGEEVVAASKSELTKPEVAGQLCRRWKQKAESGNWFSVKEQEQYAWLVDPNKNTEHNILFGDIPACQPLNDLVMNCQEMPSWEIDLILGHNTSVEDVKYGLKEIAQRKGCRTIVGLNAICDAFRILSKNRVKVPGGWAETISECLDSALRKSVGHFERPVL